MFYLAFYLFIFLKKQKKTMYLLSILYYFIMRGGTGTGTSKRTYSLHGSYVFSYDAWILMAVAGQI